MTSAGAKSAHALLAVICSLLYPQIGSLLLLTAAAIYPVIIVPVMGAPRSNEVLLSPQKGLLRGAAL